MANLLVPYAVNIGQAFLWVTDIKLVSGGATANKTVPHTCLSCDRGGSYNSATSTLFNHLLRSVLVA